MEVNEQVEKFKDFLDKNYKEKIAEKVRKGKKRITISFKKLTRHDYDLAEILLEQPYETLKAFELAIEQYEFIEGTNKFKIRVKDTPKTIQMRVRDKRAEDYNKMLTFEGVIESKSQVKPRTTSAKFECPSCGNIISVLQLEAIFKEPSKCGCGRKGKFMLISKELINAFTIKLQELPENVNYDPELQGISVLFKDDLTEQEIEEKVYQGIRIKVTGILHEVEIHKQGDKKSIDVDFLLEANYIEFTENEFFDYKISDEEMKEINKIAKDPNAVKILSEEIYKKIYGYPIVKKALLLQLFGGVSDYSVNPKERGEIHILMIGDPGEAKSDFESLQQRHSLKSSRVNSKTTSGVGLVGVNIKDDVTGAWSIKVGPIPRAHKGICLIDEFNTLSDEDKDFLLEPMESGTITMTKAAQATFKAQTSFLVACNPKDGYFDHHELPFTQFAISQPLITRFDLIFVFKDQHEEEYERTRARVMLTRKYYEELITPEFIKKYVSYAKKIKPELTKEMRENYIPDIFAEFKKLTQTNVEGRQFPISPRHVNVIKRLAEAKARVHLKKTVGKAEVDFAIDLIKESLKQSSIDPDTGKIDTFVVESGVTATQRNVMYVVKDKINEMSEKIKNIPIEDLVEEVMGEGKFKVERVEESIEKLIREGVVYEVRNGFIRKI